MYVTHFCFLDRGGECDGVIIVTFYTRLAAPTEYKICAIKQVSPWGCHLLALTERGWDLRLGRPFTAPECGCGNSDPAPAVIITLLGPGSPLPSVSPWPLHFRPGYVREACWGKKKNGNANCSLPRRPVLKLWVSQHSGNVSGLVWWDYSLA